MPIGVNLLPWREHKARQRRRRQHRQMLLAAGCGIALILIARLPLEAMRSTQAQENISLQQRMATLEHSLADLQTLREQNTRLADQLAMHKTLSRQRAAWLDEFDTIIRIAPEQIAFTRLENHNNDWRVNGLSAGTGALPDFLAALQGSPAFADAHIERIEPAVAANPVNQVRFVITAQLAEAEAPP